MEAKNRPIRNWMQKIQIGEIRLPEFQREEVWKYQLVSRFLQAVINEKPLGAFLVLNVDPNHPPFNTSSIAGVENDVDKCTEHLLDGQQRLVALWRSFRNTHIDGRRFYVFEDNTVEGIKKSSRYKWIGNHKAEFDMNVIPVSILEPGEGGLEKSQEWRNAATQDPDESKRLHDRVKDLRDKFSDTDIPYLSMPTKTTPEEAIDTFVNVNQSSMRLTDFDIAVALHRSETSESLRGLVENAKQDILGIVALEKDRLIGDWILKAACVQQGIMPTKSYKDLNYKHLERDWDALRSGLEWTVELLEAEHIWDSRRLPSTVPLRVLPALHKPFSVLKRDKQSQARRLIKSYLWRAFTTDWYVGQANQELFKDFKALKKALEDEHFALPSSSTGKPETIFDNELPSMEELLQAGWPYRFSPLRRAILAISIRREAKDMETGENISKTNIWNREYHHIFPKNLLRGHAPNEEPDLALNCMLLKSPTNKAWRDEWPGDYIMERYDHSGLKGERAQREIEKRLSSHFVPSSAILRATKSSRESLAEVYQAFREERANLMMEAIKKLCNGEDL